MYEGVQENIIILNVTIFCVQSKECCNIKFYCEIITSFDSQRAMVFQKFFKKQKKIQKILKSTLRMSVINLGVLTLLFSETKGKQNLRSLKICVQPLYIHSYEILSRYLTFC